MLLQSPETPFVSAVYVAPVCGPLYFKKITKRETEALVAKYFPVPTANLVSLTDQIQKRKCLGERR